VQLGILQVEATHPASVCLATGQPALDTVANLSRSQTHYNAMGRVDDTIDAAGERAGFACDAQNHSVTVAARHAGSQRVHAEGTGEGASRAVNSYSCDG
jgi:hypothetical protein